MVLANCIIKTSPSDKVLNNLQLLSYCEAHVDVSHGNDNGYVLCFVRERKKGTNKIKLFPLKI